MDNIIYDNHIWSIDAMEFSLTVLEFYIFGIFATGVAIYLVGYYLED